MKIGIISINMYSKGLNFACPLHTYAFQQFLLRNGINSTIISYTPIYYNCPFAEDVLDFSEKYDLRHPHIFFDRLVKQRLEEGNPVGIEDLVRERDNWKAMCQKREIRYDKFQKFIDEKYIKTDKVYNSDLLEIDHLDFDCFICATDVIWKNDPAGGLDRGFFLASKAMEGKWKIAYSASRGANFCKTKEEERRFFHYLDDIDFISVREASLKDYIEKYSDKTVTHVLDPVMLHDKSFYDDLAEEPKEKGYLLLYYVMGKADATVRQAINFAKENNLEIIEVTDLPLPEGSIGNYDGVKSKFKYDIGIEEWLGYIKYADVVFTNSFHASCFSILFEKEFYAGPRAGDKVSNLLETFKLTDRRFNTKTQLSELDNTPINYDAVSEILLRKRKESADFLLGAIKVAESSERRPVNYEWWKREQGYPIVYESIEIVDGKLCTEGDLNGKEIEDNKSRVELNDMLINDGLSRFSSVLFYRLGYESIGWRIRFKIDNEFFWYLEDETYVLCDEWDKEKHAPIREFAHDERIPYIPVDRISLMVAEALWQEADIESFVLRYHSGSKECDINEKEKAALGEGNPIKRVASGSLEYLSIHSFKNDGSAVLDSCCYSRNGYLFDGWRIRVRHEGNWYWLLNNGTMINGKFLNKDLRKMLFVVAEGEKVPFIPMRDIDMIVVEATWKSNTTLNSNNTARIKPRAHKHLSKKLRHSVKTAIERIKCKKSGS